MMKSKDERTQELLDKISAQDLTKYQILMGLREIVFEIFPNVKERMMYGGIMLSLDNDFGGLFVYKSHVSFEFSNGYRFRDSEKFLEGNGKFRRHLKLRSLDDIKNKNVSFFVKQVIEIGK